MIKEWVDYKWYCCNPKASYQIKTTESTWTPVDEEELEIPTTLEFQEVNDEMKTDDAGRDD